MAFPTPPTFNILSIGHRGVGKTVFLAGSYAELQSGKQVQTADIWFEGHDQPAQRNMQKLLAYVAQTGHYPPATLKITDFNFSAKTRGWRQDKILCQFRWSDIPGEICRLDNPDFEPMLLDSHGCCVFIDAEALVSDASYLTQLEETVKQVEVIASLAHQSGLRYIFALILTKCDLLETGPAKLLKIQEKLHSLNNRLDVVKASYRRFYSSIPIVRAGGTPMLKADGASMPLLWMIAELNKVHALAPPQTLAGGFNQTLANTPSLSERAGLSRPWWLRPLPLLLGAGLVVAMGLMAVLPWGAGRGDQDLERAQVPTIAADPSARRIRDLEAALQKNPQDEQVLTELAQLYEDADQYKPALDYTERLLELRPEDVNLHFQWAGLQALLGRSDLEEGAYDRILAIDGENVMALTKKAILRSSAGDLTTGKQLFTKAEQLVPEGTFKQTIRDIAKQWTNP